MSLIDENTSTSFTVIDALNYIIGLHEVLQSGNVTILQAAKIKHEILLWQKIIRYIKELTFNSNSISYYTKLITTLEITNALNSQGIDNYFLQKQVLKYYEY